MDMEDMIEMQLQLMELDRFDIYWIHNVWDAPHWTEELAKYYEGKDITFFAYMVLEQGALSRKYDTSHPMPEGSARAETYNPVLDKLEVLKVSNL